MSSEAVFIDRLRALTPNVAARGLIDDAAVLEVGGARLVLTHDMLVEGIHFLPCDPPASVAWKLLAVNLSDLAAKGAKPLGALMGYTLAGDGDWDSAFIAGLGEALAAFDLPLLGGDTVKAQERSLGLTAIGIADGQVASRSGAREGDAVYVTGVIGDAGLGLELARSGAHSPIGPLNAYQRPQPQLEAGRALSALVTAMMDVSDGLLIDASRLADASGLGVRIDLNAVPLSADYLTHRGGDRAARLAAVTAGDDYELLFTANMSLPRLPCPATRIGQMVRGAGLEVFDAAGSIPLPARLGWEHG